MLLKLFLICSVVCLSTIGEVLGEDRQEGSGFGDNEVRTQPEDDVEDIDDDEEISGEKNAGRVWEEPPQKETVTVTHHQRQPNIDKEPELSLDNADEDEEEELEEGTEDDEDDVGGDGIVIDEDEGDKDEEQPDGGTMKEPVPVYENSLITHPGILAAIIVGGVLVLVSLILFFLLIVFCVRKKDEGTYDLDKAMKAKLKHITYTKAESSEKEFFA